ncbi:NFACT family protein [Myxosarcina sp. GI1]|uniref:Rqc2 family fibronectin-binding protein n=1 Tax=Myxosarcina sp. GI1 TaxID=1541065 RepID=UPI0005652E0B|nr:NFACT family protein [Myxosarcina sp. GI1]
MQPVDYTTLMAVRAELVRDWIPSRIEQVFQRDLFTIAIALRTLKTKAWLTICWHPQAARINIGEAPPRSRDTFTFSDQLRHQLNNLALIDVAAVAPWERVLDLQFAQRPGEKPLWHFYTEIMGKYSNAILTDASLNIVAPARQISSSQSSVRPIQTGAKYELPPPITKTAPRLEESFSSWQERVSLIPGNLKQQLINSYRGLSPKVAAEIINSAQLSTQQSTADLLERDWQELFDYWQKWLKSLANREFIPGWTNDGYTVLGWQKTESVKNVQILLDRYYREQLNQQQFQQLHHQLSQKLNSLLEKAIRKADTFSQRLAQSADADISRQQADLLMANLYKWQPGMKSIALSDFETGEPIKIKLNPEQNAVTNAQSLYKQHQKLKRAKDAVRPLLADTEAEINYLQQVKTALERLENDWNASDNKRSNRSLEDLQALQEIRQELVQQSYLTSERQEDTRQDNKDFQPYRYTTPSGFELWIGRNNRQNDWLTFRIANEYDLWFHTQEIPGSHALLRLEPGAIPDEKDLQFAANFAAYYSQARQSEIVPVVYTQPKHVYKPKGAKPGMAIYKQETVIWGRPQTVTKN